MKLAAFCALTALVVWALFTVRAQRSAKAQATLCTVIYRLEANAISTLGKPGTAGYAYYHRHPDELRVAIRNGRDTLKQLPCQP